MTKNGFKMNDSLITKKIIHAGTKTIPITNGCKVCFHYCTRKCDDEKTVIDDSRLMNSPMELIIGKKFKLAIWETAVKTMALNEVSSFIVDKNLLQNYPFISKTIRDAKNANKERRINCCAATFHTQLDYPDLNDLLKNPCNLEFIIELLSIELPDQYEKEIWQLEENEKIALVPQLKDEGNKLYYKKDYLKAAEKYAFAIGILEQLMLKEKPKDEEWNELNKIKLPILLNYAQCKLLNSEYYSVIQHCSTVLESDPFNVKALFRRGKAHVGAWNFKEAENDFKKVAELDNSLKNFMAKEINEMELLKKSKEAEDKMRLIGKIF